MHFPAPYRERDGTGQRWRISGWTRIAPRPAESAARHSPFMTLLAMRSRPTMGTIRVHPGDPRPRPRDVILLSFPRHLRNLRQLRSRFTTAERPEPTDINSIKAVR